MRWMDWDRTEAIKTGGCRVGGDTEKCSSPTAAGAVQATLDDDEKDDDEEEEEEEGPSVPTEWVCPPLDVVIGSDVICELLSSVPS